MLDKALQTITHSDSFYFQLYPLSLYIANPDCVLPAPGTTYRFTLLKGQQKYDDTKLPIQASFREVQGRNVMVMPRCPLNFYVPSFNKNPEVQFLVNMYQTENHEEYFIADHSIPIKDYVKDYKKNRNVRFEHTVKFSEDYELEFELYVEKSRIALEKVVKEYKNQRSLKSPLRERPPQAPVPTDKRVFTRDSGKAASRGSEVTPSEKEQRQSLTELSSSRNKKIESIKSSRSKEVKPERPTDRTENDRESEAAFEKIQSSVRDPFKKGREPSEASSKAPVPEVALHYKAITKKESQIKMADSQRLPSTGSSTIKTEESKPVAAQSQAKDQALMALFLLISMIIMYYSMHPSRKV